MMRQHHELLITFIGIKVPTTMEIIPDFNAANICIEGLCQIGRCDVGVGLARSNASWNGERRSQDETQYRHQHVRPAFIDVGGWCLRSHLALKGLRITLDQTTLELGYLEWNNNGNNESPQKYTLYNEDGAWTAINVCSKAGRIEGQNRPSKYFMSCRILESFPIPSLVVA